MIRGRAPPSTPHDTYIPGPVAATRHATKVLDASLEEKRAGKCVVVGDGTNVNDLNFLASVLTTRRERGFLR